MGSPLNTFEAGNTVVIERIKPSISSRLKSMGIFPKSQFRVMYKMMDGGMVINIDGCKMAINSLTASLILCVAL